MEALVTIINKSGVHARPAAMLAQMGRRYTSKSHIQQKVLLLMEKYHSYNQFRIILWYTKCL